MAKVMENRVKRVKTDFPDTSSIMVEPAYSPAPTDTSFVGESTPSPGSISGEALNTSQLVLPPEALNASNLLSLSQPLVGALVSEGVAGESVLVPAASIEMCLQRKLTEAENLMLQEVVQVYDLSFTVDLEPLIHINKLDPSLNQLVNQSSITVLRLIKFAKRLEQFVRLPQECQIGILKGTWIHILLLRSVALYDKDRDVWVTPRGDIPTEILKNATGFDDLHDDHRCYCRSIKSITHDDLTIVIVLLVIVLFSPEGPHVAARELVSNIQDKYLILLKHYLESKYNYVRAAEMFAQLMAKVKELKELAEVHGKYLLDVNPREIEPIMLEILDLK